MAADRGVTFSGWSRQKWHDWIDEIFRIALDGEDVQFNVVYARPGEITPELLEWAKKVAADLEPPAQTVREQGEWEQLGELAEKATPGPWIRWEGNRQFVEVGGTGQPIASMTLGTNYRPEDYLTKIIPQLEENAAFIAAANPETIRRAVAYIRELERQREVKWNAWLKANQDLARLNTVLADALRIATESCMIFLFNPRPTVQAQVEHFMQQAESKLAASPQEKK